MTMDDKETSDKLERLIHLEDKAEQHEKQIQDHGEKMGGYYSKLHTLEINLSVMLAKWGFWERLFIACILFVFTWVGAKLLGLL